ncbi:MAG: Uncharacterised protein [SAR116 cluster bacterium]|nr:MAG: Uncharacterised protein [SAR116 cluster bacterium]
MDDLCRWLAIPWHKTAGCRVRPQDYILADFVQHRAVKEGTRHRLAEHIFRKTQPVPDSCLRKFVYWQNLAARNTGNITDKAFHLGDGLILQPLGHYVVRHV